MEYKHVTFGLQSLIATCALGALAACSDSNVSGSAGLYAPMETAVVGVAAAPAPALAAAPAQARGAMLAYEHRISIEMDRQRLPARLREIEAACNADRASKCTVLDIALQSDRDLPSGNIRMRLAPGGVEPIVSLASKEAKVTSRNTHAEDLSEPVADTERQLALLTLHRERLTEFMKSKDIKIDQLITVSKELATVQSQIDSLSTQRANLRRRIDTDLLSISLTLPSRAYVVEPSPVKNALRYFGNDFREALAMVIRFIAILLPWLVIILPGLFLLRWFWGWIGRRLSFNRRAADSSPPA